MVSTPGTCRWAEGDESTSGGCAACCSTPLNTEHTGIHPHVAASAPSLSDSCESGHGPLPSAEGSIHIPHLPRGRSTNLKTYGRARHCCTPRCRETQTTLPVFELAILCAVDPLLAAVLTLALSRLQYATGHCHDWCKARVLSLQLNPACTGKVLPRVCAL